MASPLDEPASGASPTFDEVVHAPNRLQICAFLDPLDEAEFSVVRDALGVSDSVTSKQVKVLQSAGYVTVSKPTGNGRVKTWLALTPEGRRAYRAHVAALRLLLG
ncbi:MarR family transcriptional regulator [Curtobacterium sp. MCJR17_055]|uniref:transcriptional regulator n=1 Tax=unclassified Curtobacterium TaxID=257496 RepID=UPI000D89B8FA|nr:MULTISPECIES: transcriptional regulator [unclassified Curtobacterium]PYY34556.1 MarR family transcriptional regulator [Curtobacterium sp. MCBD17_029]PYY57628.1 MarR family transcriptional regulator [Curtobacterium sp. MCPF17_015]PYY58286.1 MarR family transcriptional regulator [Curtobacterium sp. MCJR17_055]WIB36827.1 transcriptional regulator [Curtobacterium sp. MCJR17_043]